MKGCKVPGCSKEEHKTWATVPLCEEHYAEIKEETARYYTGKQYHKISDDERVIYHSIRHLTPWGKKARL